MGLLYIHGEDKKYHIYRLRSREIYWSYFLIFFLSIVGSFFVIYSLLVMLVLVFVGMGDYAPIGIKRWKTRIKGKK